MGIDSRLMTDSEWDQDLEAGFAKAEPCVNEMATESCSDTDMGPCAAAEAGDGANDWEFCTSIEVIGKELKRKQCCSANSDTKEVSNNSELHPPLESYAEEVILFNEQETNSEVQVNKIGSNAEFQPNIHVQEVIETAELESLAGNDAEDKHCTKRVANKETKSVAINAKEVVSVGEMETCAGNDASEPKDDGSLELFRRSNVMEVPNACNMVLCPKDEVKAPSNDDVQSEVSDPYQSPKNISSSLTISSQPLDVFDTDNGCCGEVTSACCKASFVDGSFHKENLSKCKLESIATSCAVLEIPKHIRPTGIRKITFKFRKRKEDDGTGLCVAVQTLDSGKSAKGFRNNQISSQPLTNNGIDEGDLKSLENAEMDLNMAGSELHSTQSPSSNVLNRELMMSKKIIPDNCPKSVKSLLSTGILEGAKVKYISLSGEKEIPGIIKGGGYLCGCGVCNFSKVVSAYEFELHAGGTKTRHPNNHIYLDNGKPLYSIIQVLRTAPFSTLDSVMKSVAGSYINEEYFHAWKAKLQYCNDGGCADGAYQSMLSDMYQAAKGYCCHPTEGSPNPTSCHYSHATLFNQQSYIEVPVEQKRLIKKPKHNFCSSVGDHKKTAEGGTKKRDNDLHKLLFMPNGLPDGTSLAYYSKGKRILEGYKHGNGIVCSCCNTEISPSQFESHAGWAVKRQPYRHIYTSSGFTLHDVALMLANGQKLAASGIDGMCAICGDGGDLNTCNGCRLAFHAACVVPLSLPTDYLHCPSCGGKIGPGGRVSGDSGPIILRLKRVVKPPEFQPGGCIICRSQDFSAVKFDDRTVIICDQCEMEFHVGCLRETGMCDLKELPKDKWFCCDNCYKIFEALQTMACTVPDDVPASVSTALYKKQTMIGLNDGPENEIRWCILNGKNCVPEHFFLLSRAAAIFRECFDPIVAKSGRDLIPVMVYGKNISGQDFSGMYCVVLIVKSIVVSAALLRIFGQEVAELPLVATSIEYQGKGYFQALFSCIEGLLSSMNVKHLVLPAAEEAEPMWTNKLGFMKTSHEQMLKYRYFQITIFKGTSLLEKDVPKQCNDHDVQPSDTQHISDAKSRLASHQIAIRP